MMAQRENARLTTDTAQTLGECAKAARAWCDEEASGETHLHDLMYVCSLVQRYELGERI